MKKLNVFGLAIVGLGAIVVGGCQTAPPDVTVNPPSTTIVHEHTPPNVTINPPPNVTINPPASTNSHTETHTETTVPPDTGGQATTGTSTTTTG